MPQSSPSPANRACAKEPRGPAEDGGPFNSTLADFLKPIICASRIGCTVGLPNGRIERWFGYSWAFADHHAGNFHNRRAHRVPSAGFKTGIADAEF